MLRSWNLFCEFFFEVVGLGFGIVLELIEVFWIQTIVRLLVEASSKMKYGHYFHYMTSSTMIS